MSLALGALAGLVASGCGRTRASTRPQGGTRPPGHGAMGRRPEQDAVVVRGHGEATEGRKAPAGDRGHGQGRKYAAREQLGMAGAAAGGG